MYSHPSCHRMVHVHIHVLCVHRRARARVRAALIVARIAQDANFLYAVRYTRRAQSYCRLRFTSNARECVRVSVGRA